MSNVPAYPKNPVLVHEPPKELSAITRHEDQIATESTLAAPEAVECHAFWRSFGDLLQRDPITAVLVAAGVGIVVGAMLRK